MTSCKKYTVYTIAHQITFMSDGEPAFTEDGKIIFKKLSGNEITFMERNVICFDEINVNSNAERTTTE